MYNDFTKELYQLLNKYGLDPIYIVTIFVILFHIVFDLKKYKMWHTISYGNKFYTIVGLVFVIGCILLSVLRFVGII